MNDDVNRLELSAEHLQASADALTDLAREVSTPVSSAPGKGPLFVDLVHYEHGYFLSPLLRGFSMLPSTGRDVLLPVLPAVEGVSDEFAYEVLSDWATNGEIEHVLSPRAHALLNPRGATNELPFTWATVAGHPVTKQVREVLEALASLLARQALSHEELADAGATLPAHVQSIEADMARVTTGMVDSVTRSGWRAAARELRHRSVSSGRPFRVRYRSTAFDAAALAQRAPLLREAYNRLTPVREAVDRTASGMARSMYLTGKGPTDVLRTLNDQFEHLGMRQFLAHAVRDAFVCGNGVMVMADVVGGGTRLVAPDDLLAVRGEVATVRDMNGDQDVGPVMHLRGGRQVGSELGVSFLEPFVVTCAHRDTFLSVLLSAELMLASGSAPTEARSWATAMRPYAQERLRDLEAGVRRVLGQATQQFVDAASGTYFEGQELMTPSAGRVALVESLDETVARGSA